MDIRKVKKLILKEAEKKRVGKRKTYLINPKKSHTRLKRR